MTCDPRIPADEQGDIIASQAAGYRHVHDFKTGRNRIAKRAEEEKWSVERTEAAYALLDFKYGPHGEKQRLRLQRVVLNALDRRGAEFFKKLLMSDINKYLALKTALINEKAKIESRCGVDPV